MKIDEIKRDIAINWTQEDKRSFIKWLIDDICEEYEDMSIEALGEDR